MICKLENEYLREITDIAWSAYEAECKQNSDLPRNGREELASCIEKEVNDGNGLMYIDNNKVLGYFLLSKYEREDGSLWCSIPFWGYGAVGQEREKVISRLFQQIACVLCRDHAVHFEVKLYAHDIEIVKLFAFLQFGIQCEEGIRNTSEQVIVPTVITADSAKDTSNCSVREVKVSELSHQEIECKWNEIWALLKQLIIHLQMSPIFYPGKEFTEEIYHSFFLDDDTRVFAAHENGNMLGIIEANKGGNSFLTNQENIWNTGEIYVLEEERGKGVSQILLRYVNETLKADGIKALWVEHGTANPNARGFWNKYFHTYCYSCIRDIHPL